MNFAKPVVDHNSLLKWIDCPGKVFLERKTNKKRFDYKSFLRHMLMGTLKFAYSNAADSKKIDLLSHTGGIWISMLRRHGFPNPEATIRQMNEFYSSRNDAFLLIASERLKAVNKDHWWELGNNFHPSYFDWRDEINKFQHLLGFPPIDLIKNFQHENEYYPATLADCYADYMDAVKILAKRNYPLETVQFDVPLYLVLDDVVLKTNIDIIFEREKIFKGLSSLAPGTVAASLIYTKHFGNPDSINSDIRMTNDIRYPVLGVEYLTETGEKVKFVGHEAVIVSSGLKSQAWSEDQKISPDNVAILQRLNMFANTFYKADRLGVGVPKPAPNDFCCASCSFLPDCFDPQKINTDNYAEKTMELEDEAFEVFKEEFDADAELCDDRIKTMELILKTLDFIKVKNEPGTIEAFYHITENKMLDFMSERNRNASTKKKI